MPEMKKLVIGTIVYEVADGIARNTALSNGYAIGQTKSTLRTDLGDSWVLCNGDSVDSSKYPELAKLCTKVPVISGDFYTYIKAKE